MIAKRPSSSIGGRLHRPVLRREATYSTLAGPVVVARTRYRLAGEPYATTVDPIGVRVGVVGAGWLPQTCIALEFVLVRASEVSIGPVHVTHTR